MKIYSDEELNLRSAKTDLEWMKLDIELALHAKKRGENGNIMTIPAPNEDDAVRNDIIREKTNKLMRKVLSLLAMVGAMEGTLDSVAEEYNLDTGVIRNEIIKRYTEIGKNAGIELE